MTDQEKIVQLLYKYTQDAINAQEWEELQEWVRSSPNAKYLFDRLSNGETLDAALSEFHPNNKKLTGDQIWMSVARQLPQANPSVIQETGGNTMPRNINIARNRVGNGKIIFKKWWAAAAAVILLISGYLFFFNNKVAPVPEQITVHTSPAENKRMFLPDNSEVELGANTTLEYALNFKNQRNIVLVGKATFDVMKDPEHPFRIMLPDDLVVEVVGTSFNINSYQHALSTSLQVTEGVVKVLKGEILLGTLKKGEQIIYNRESASAVITTKTINEQKGDSSALATGVLTYDAMSISDLSALLNDQFGISLVNKTGKDIYSTTGANLNFNKKQSAREIVAVFCSVTRYKYNWADKNTVILQQ